MKPEDLPPELLARIKQVTAKRPRTVINHILEHGHITTEELKDKYGYNHPPRAARDVREEGIPLKTTRVPGSDGRMIGAYTFGDLDEIEGHKLGGRRVFSKDFARALFTQFHNRCGFCNDFYEDRYLQVDHRIPYEVAGESGRVGGEDQPELFMPVCGTCNRKKSWSCEHCENWKGAKNADQCKSCYWSSPESFAHIAGRQIRRLELVWSGEEVSQYDAIRREAKLLHLSVQDYIKKYLGSKK